jgi:hypothetical protein
MANIQRIYIDLLTPADPAILIAEDALFTTNLELILKSQIVNVHRVALAPARDGYAYANFTELVMQLADGRAFRIELQNVLNQPTWSGGTAADADQAVADVLASL